MKTIEAAECKKCGARVVRNDKKVVLNPGDDFELVLLRVARCSACKEAEPRTSGGARRRIKHGG